MNISGDSPRTIRYLYNKYTEKEVTDLGPALRKRGRRTFTEKSPKGNVGYNDFVVMANNSHPLNTHAQEDDRDMRVKITIPVDIVVLYSWKTFLKVCSQVRELRRTHSVVRTR